MEFYDMLDQLLTLLHSRGRMSYRALKCQFHLDDAFIEELKEALLYAHSVVDDAGRGLIWTGDPDPPPEGSGLFCWPAHTAEGLIGLK